MVYKLQFLFVLNLSQCNKPAALFQTFMHIYFIIKACFFCFLSELVLLHRTPPPHLISLCHICCTTNDCNRLEMPLNARTCITPSAPEPKIQNRSIQQYVHRCKNDANEKTLKNILIPFLIEACGMQRRI